MARNRSLDDFIDTQSGSDAPDPAADADAEAEADADAEADTDADAYADPDPEPGSIDTGAAEEEQLDAKSSVEPGPESSPAAAGLDAGPATTTMAWAPDGAACEACGSVVERRWRDDDVLVCIDCKEW